MRYRLRTLLIATIILPPIFAAMWLSRWKTAAAIHRASIEKLICLAFVLIGAVVALAWVWRSPKVSF